MTHEITIVRKCKELCIPEAVCMAIFENKDNSSQEEKDKAFQFVTTTRLKECKIGYK